MILSLMMINLFIGNKFIYLDLRLIDQYDHYLRAASLASKSSI
jgi:hypothetical protein